MRVRGWALYVRNCVGVLPTDLHGTLLTGSYPCTKFERNRPSRSWDLEPSPCTCIAPQLCRASPYGLTVENINTLQNVASLFHDFHGGFHAKNTNISVHTDTEGKHRGRHGAAAQWLLYVTHRHLLKERTDCQTPLTIKHLLFTCSQYNHYRQPLTHYWQTHNIPLTLPNILGDTHHDLTTYTLTLIRDTGHKRHPNPPYTRPNVSSQKRRPHQARPGERRFTLLKETLP